MYRMLPYQWLYVLHDVFSHIKMTYPKLTEAWHCWSRAWCGTIWWYNKSGYCTYALNPACAYPRITVTFDSPQRGSLVFTVGADEDENKNNSLLWSSVSHGVRTERLKNIENLCQACKVKMLYCKSFPKTWPHVTRWQDVGQLTRLLLPESPPRQLRISWMIMTISMWGYLLRGFLGCHRCGWISPCVCSI